MEMPNTNTQTENSKKYYVNPQEAQKLMAATEECIVVATNQREVTPAGFETSYKDVTSATVQPAAKIKEGIKPAQQGDSLVPVTAAEMHKNGVKIVVDRRVGRAEEVKEVPENETLKATRERVELEKSAQKKYEQNNPTER